MVELKGVVKCRYPDEGPQGGLLLLLADDSVVDLDETIWRAKPPLGEKIRIVLEPWVLNYVPNGVRYGTLFSV